MLWAGRSCPDDPSLSHALFALQSAPEPEGDDFALQAAIEMKKTAVSKMLKEYENTPATPTRDGSGTDLPPPPPPPPPAA